MKFIDRNQARLFDRSTQSIAGIENHLEDQVALIQELADYCDELPFPDEETAGFRYYFQNDYFSYGDAIALFGVLRHFRPQRIIEVGSGFSLSRDSSQQSPGQKHPIVHEESGRQPLDPKKFIKT